MAISATTKRSARSTAVRATIAVLATATVLALTLATANAISEPAVNTTITIPTTSDCAVQTTGPFKMAISTDGSTAYVTLNGDGRIAQIDTATNTVTATACTGARYPEDVAVSPDGSTIYVTNSAASTLRVLATADMSTVTDVNVGYAGNGVDVATTPASVGKVYVLRHSEGSLVVLDPSDNSVTTTVSVGASSTRRASGIAVSVDGSTLYALVDAGIAVVDTATDTVTETIAMTNTQAISIAPDGSFLYVVGGAGNDSLMRVRTSDNTIVATETIGSGPTSVEITPDGLHALVVLNASNSVVFVDTTTNTVTSTVPVGGSPYGSVIAPSGTFAFVADWGGGYGDTITRLDLGWSAPPTSEPPTSEPPTSEPPTSEPPTSEPPTSESPTSITSSTVATGSLPTTGTRTDVYVIAAVLLAALGATLSVISRRRV